MNVNGVVLVAAVAFFTAAAEGFVSPPPCSDFSDDACTADAASALCLVSKGVCALACDVSQTDGQIVAIDLDLTTGGCATLDFRGITDVTESLNILYSSDVLTIDLSDLVSVRYNFDVSFHDNLEEIKMTNLYEV